MRGIIRGVIRHVTVLEAAMTGKISVNDKISTENLNTKHNSKSMNNCIHEIESEGWFRSGFRIMLRQLTKELESLTSNYYTSRLVTRTALRLTHSI